MLNSLLYREKDNEIVDSFVTKNALKTQNITYNNQKYVKKKYMKGPPKEIHSVKIDVGVDKIDGSRVPNPPSAVMVNKLPVSKPFVKPVLKPVPVAVQMGESVAPRYISAPAIGKKEINEVSTNIKGFILKYVSKIQKNRGNTGSQKIWLNGSTTMYPIAGDKPICKWIVANAKNDPDVSKLLID